MYCKKCGNEIKISQKFCSHCGTEVTEIEQNKLRFKKLLTSDDFSNYVIENKDDHAKNFSFLMNEFGEWKLSPAYDLTFSNGPGGEQSTMVLGEGRNITVKHLSKLGEEAQLSKEFIDT